jgi:predicted LPLAT superfamily acyltransferase
MGQAKRRGTFEERRDQAVQRNHARLEAHWKAENEQAKADADRLAAMTPEQRERVLKATSNGPRKMMLMAVLSSLLTQQPGGKR